MGEGASIDVDDVPLTVVADGVLERVATTVTPRPMIAVGRQRVVAIEDLRESTFLVVLDAISDPGNLGTIIRAAESAGAGAVVVGGGSTSSTRSAWRDGRRALLHSSCACAGCRVRARSRWQLGHARVGTSASAPHRYDDVDLTVPVAVVLASEAHGLGADVATSVDEMVSIPIVGRSESLNVAAAAAVLCFEVARQRRAP